MTARKPAARMTRKRIAPKPARPTRKTHVLPQEVLDDIEHLDALRNQSKVLGEDIVVVQTRVIEAIDSLGLDKTSFDQNGARFSLTRQQTSRVVLDDAKLAKKLGTALWNKVSTRSLDRKKLEAHIKSGEVRTTDVAACSDEVPNAPFVKIVRKVSS